MVAASVLMVSGADKAKIDLARARFDAHDKAAYATDAMIQYVNPGLVFSVVSATIGSDGTITVNYKVTDPTASLWIPPGFRRLARSQPALFARIFLKDRPSTCPIPLGR